MSYDEKVIQSLFKHSSLIAGSPEIQSHDLWKEIRESPEI